MKQEFVRLRSTAEQEEIGGVHSEGICEIVPSVSCVDESTSLTQSTCTVNKPGTCISHDVGKFVI